jgi:ferric-dicitrate binding protein FerR (iron transport regulator)
MTRWRRTTACERATQWISLELDGELSRLEQAALARHLRRCDRCRSANTDIGRFTSLLRAAPPVEPARAVVVVTPPWARRRTRAKIRGGVFALAVAIAGLLSVGVLPHSGGEPPSTIGFSGAEQHVFARDHAENEPTLFVVAESTPPPSLAGRPLL